MSKITHVKLNHFTAFGELEVTFSKGVNILIGANGTGKTHLLKVLYAACAITVGEDKERGFMPKLTGVFRPYQGMTTRLIRRSPGLSSASLAVTRDNGLTLQSTFRQLGGGKSEMLLTPDMDAHRRWAETPLESVYIPVKEMLAHAPGFLSTVARREIAFEEVYTDILQHAYLPRLKEIDADRQRMLKALQQAKVLDGKIVTKGEHFFLKNRHGELEFTLLAEGIRKLALIWLLIQNGALQPGSVLFWDEPEANLNPSLMGQVVEVILELQRLGVQVFLTTHNYVLLKEFDLRQKAGDAIRYVSLFREDSGVVMSRTSDDYLGISPNAIADTFSHLYDGEMRRSLGM